LVNRRQVAVYVPALTGGGAERVAAVLARGLQESGHHVELLVDYEAHENRDLVCDVDVSVLGVGHGASVLRLARLLASGRLDIVVSMGASTNVKLVAAHLLARSSAKLILSYHATLGAVSGKLSWSAYPLAPFLVRYAARTVSVSNHLLNDLVKSWHVPPKRVVRIYNPVPVERALPIDADGLAARPRVVMGMGRLTPEKDFATLIRAVALLPDRDTRLVIYGEGPERKPLLELAGSLGLADRVELPGYVINPWPVFAEARCFVISSPAEAFGNVAVEALASGLPVVTTDCGGPVEILDHGRYGTVVPVADPARLAAAIAEALKRPGDPEPRVARANEFATARIVEQYNALFDAVLGDPRREERGAQALTDERPSPPHDHKAPTAS
jgi:glycosyltransferase involved in cell wall biosynthesis